MQIFAQGVARTKLEILKLAACAFCSTPHSLRKRPRRTDFFWATPGEKVSQNRNMSSIKIGTLRFAALHVSDQPPRWMAASISAFCVLALNIAFLETRYSWERAEISSLLAGLPSWS